MEHKYFFRRFYRLSLFLVALSPLVSVVAAAEESALVKGHYAEGRKDGSFAIAAHAADAVMPTASKKEAIPQYRLEPNPHDTGPDRSEVCAAFLKILNTTPFEQIYQDIFLNMLKGRGKFDAMDWQYLSDGEQKFGEVPFKQIEMDAPRPNWITGRIDGFKKYKEAVGGFDYYLTHADVWHDGKQLPILFYVNKNLQELDKRKSFDYVVMEEDLSGPIKKGYGSEKRLTSSYSMQIFKYKDKEYILDSSGFNRPFLTEMHSTLSGCTYRRLNKD